MAIEIERRKSKSTFETRNRNKEQSQAPSVYFTLWETIINFHVVHCRLNSISLSCLLPSEIEWSVVSSLLWYRTCFYGFSLSCVFVVVAPTGILSFCDGVGSLLVAELIIAVACALTRSSNDQRAVWYVVDFLVAVVLKSTHFPILIWK